MTSTKKRLRVGGFVYLILVIYLLYFAPFRTGTNTEINLIPFKSIQLDFYYIFLHGSSTEFILFLTANFIGNILVLMPLPYLFQMNVRGIPKWALVLFLPVTIEALQYLFQVGSADIDDVILNAFGFALGFRIYSFSTRRSLPRSEQDSP